MKGIDISKKYYEKYGEKLIMDNFPELIDQVAFGLVGEGSQAFMFDDEISKDHDFIEGFCLWMTDKDYADYGRELALAYDKLEKNTYSKLNSSENEKRYGVMSISDFYYKYTGLKSSPKNSKEWLQIPETFLATATNGLVFSDRLGEFTEIRNSLLQFYPHDVIMKKLSAYLLDMAQSGQYNLIRAYKRNDKASFYLSKKTFIDALLPTLFLIEKRYMPFYKWVFSSLRSSNFYPEKLYQDIEKIMYSDMNKACIDMVDGICVYVADWLRYLKYTKEADNFLETIAKDIYSNIKDEYLRSLNIFVGGLR